MTAKRLMAGATAASSEVVIPGVLPSRRRIARRVGSARARQITSSLESSVVVIVT